MTRVLVSAASRHGFFKRLDGDYRDWDQVSASANEIADALGASWSGHSISPLASA